MSAPRSTAVCIFGPLLCMCAAVLSIALHSWLPDACTAVHMMPLVETYTPSCLPERAATRTRLQRAEG
jgi:hypothetical protein